MLHVACRTVKQYQVPQFINVEDRIVGPLTLKQFLYLLGGVAVGAILYFSLQFALMVIAMIPVSILALAMAFLTINGQPFAKILTSALNFYMKPRLFVWKSIQHETKKVPSSGGKTGGVGIPNIRQSRLSDLAWSLDIKEKSRKQ